MASCYCGCGAKVKLSRRAFNGTARLVRIQRDGWDQRQASIREADAWGAGLESFLATGAEIEAELLAIVHGGPVRLSHPQAEMTKWLTSSRSALVAVDADGPEALIDRFAALEAEAAASAEPDAQTPAAVATDPGSRAVRRAEIAGIRAEYEAAADVEPCSICGQGFADPGAYLAHLAAEHPA